MTDASQRKGKTGRRERRIARRKKEILDAAAHIFAEKGYANATTREIAEAADMAEGTLYNYFGGKRELLLAVASKTQMAFSAMFEDASQRQIWERHDFVTLVIKGYDIFVSNLPFARTLLTEAWLDDVILTTYVADRMLEFGRFIRQLVVDQIERGVFRPVDPELAMRMILGMFIMPIVPVLRGVVPPPSHQELCTLAESAVDLLWKGIHVYQREDGGNTIC